MGVDAGGTPGSGGCGERGFPSCPCVVSWAGAWLVSLVSLVSCAFVGAVGSVVGVGGGLVLGGVPGGPVWLWFRSPWPQPNRVDVSVSDLTAGELGVPPGWGVEAVDVGAGEVCWLGVGGAGEAGAGAGDAGAGVGDAGGGAGDAGGDGDGGEGGVCRVRSGVGVVTVGPVRLGNAAGSVTRCRGVPLCAGGAVANTIDGASCRLCSPASGPEFVANRCSSWCETANAPPAAASSASPSPPRTATRYTTDELRLPMTPLSEPALTKRRQVSRVLRELYIALACTRT